MQNYSQNHQRADEKRAITNHAVLNEAYDYAKPSSFSRGMRIDLQWLTILLISGTASIDEHGNTVHVGDFRAQMRRTFTTSPACWQRGRTWHDIVRTTCYLRDIERDYEAFNEERTASTRSRDSIRCRHRPASRRSCAVPNCWSRSKPSPCSAGNSEGVSACVALLLAGCVLRWLLITGLGANRERCARAARIRRAARRHGSMKPYAGAPEDLRPFSKFTTPYYEHYTDLVEYNGAARDVPDPEPTDLDEVRIGFLGPSRTIPTSAWADRC